jgi:hypothetical protein
VNEVLQVEIALYCTIRVQHTVPYAVFRFLDLHPVPVSCFRSS